MSAVPFTRREERDDLLAFSRMWASDGNEDGWLRLYAASVIRLEATVQAETLRTVAAEVRAERLAETIRWARSHALRHDDAFLVKRLTAVLTADRAEGER